MIKRFPGGRYAMATLVGVHPMGSPCVVNITCRSVEGMRRDSTGAENRTTAWREMLG
jgi:hypothetical protein